MGNSANQKITLSVCEQLSSLPICIMTDDYDAMPKVTIVVNDHNVTIFQNVIAHQDVRIEYQKLSLMDENLTMFTKEQIDAINSGITMANNFLSLNKN